jgi:hypothetical protein
VTGDLTLQGGLQHPLGRLLQQSAFTGQLQPLAPTRSTTIVINCSSIVALTAVSVIKKLFLDHQIRRLIRHSRKLPANRSCAPGHVDHQLTLLQ